MSSARFLAKGVTLRTIIPAGATFHGEIQAVDQVLFFIHDVISELILHSHNQRKQGEAFHREGLVA